MAPLSVVTTPARHTRTSLAVLSTVCVGLLLAACGGGAPETPQTTTITVTPSPSANRSTATSSTTTTTSTTTTPALKAPTTFDEAMAHLAKGTADPAAGSAFTSPTSNIFCTVGREGAASPVGCELKEGRIAPTKAGTCPTGGPQDIGRIEFLSNGPTPICNSDSIIQVGVPVLKYGSIGVSGTTPYQCLSESIGMTCVDTTAKHGFFIARSTYALF